MTTLAHGAEKTNLKSKEIWVRDSSWTSAHIYSIDGCTWRKSCRPT